VLTPRPQRDDQEENGCGSREEPPGLREGAQALLAARLRAGRHCGLEGELSQEVIPHQARGAKLLEPAGPAQEVILEAGPVAWRQGALKEVFEQVVGDDIQLADESSLFEEALLSTV
jgi:hypothetical protein